jgi:signal transduction histidine kinase/DNA-binding response OmpR family regulator
VTVRYIYLKDSVTASTECVNPGQIQPMKQFLLILLWLQVLNLPLSAQPDSWKKKTSGFKNPMLEVAIGNKLYMGLSESSEFWEYDLISDSWIKKADFPGAQRRHTTTGFTLNSKVYLLGGKSVERMHDDFWEYDPATNKWKSLGLFLKGSREGSRYNMFAVTIQGKAYIGMGYNGNYLNDLWQYDPNKNKWERKADLPTEGRESPCAFSIKNKIYVGGGKANFKEKYHNDFWEYDPSNDEWKRKADIPFEVDKGNWFLSWAFSIGNYGYIGQSNEELNDVYVYNVCYDIWNKKSNPDCPNELPYHAFSNGNKGYLLSYNPQGDTLTKKNSLWEYTPPSSPSAATILSVSPTEGEIGSVITITGIDFDPANDLDIVEFNGIKSRVDSVNETHIYTTVPRGNTTGIVSVFIDCVQATGGATAFTAITPPPPWRRWWAYTGYGIIFIGLLLAGRNFVISRERKKFSAELERKQIEALRESEQLKTKFFSNITHEFRTPLTLIQGPVDELLARTTEPESKKLLQLAKSNSNRLLKLINQLLDLARLDAHEMKLNKKDIELKTFFNALFSQFESLATLRKIKFIWSPPGEPATVLIDEEKTEAILTNLLANALKFTGENGMVRVSIIVEEKALRMEVRDSGRGIPAQKLKNIFDRFYQVEPSDSSHAEGTGIGLALVKEYVELMNGLIRVESDPEQGTCFYVEIPIALSEIAAPVSVDEPITQILVEKVEEQDSNGDIERPLLLLIDDNEDIRQFIKTCLGTSYRYSDARHGREGLDKARNEIPDLIISDLMMPEMDGLELCTAIKKDGRTNHIPLIMLTAKAAEENKLEGLQTGADDYLVKPFNKSELALKVQNLISLREKLQARIKNELLIMATTIEASSSAEKFILKAKTFVEKHVANEELSVEMLADEMNLSREQCYRKIMALTGMSPSTFIRKLRLQKAAHLLASQWGPISQVAYEVGFGNLSYFSRAFKEEYGKLPSEYESKVN